MKNLLFVAATEGEAAPFKEQGCSVVISGVGRVNAAVATALALERGAFDAALSVGVAGALPGGGHSPGTLILADRVVYAEEGMQAPDGFHDLASMGFPLAGFFQGNSIMCDQSLVRGLASELPRAVVGAIATVATCSATDSQAQEIAKRTGALAEAMEGAAVVHSAMLMGVAAGEVRVISNRTGDRDSQGWDLHKALESLSEFAGHLPAIVGDYRSQ